MATLGFLMSCAGDKVSMVTLCIPTLTKKENSELCKDLSHVQIPTRKSDMLNSHLKVLYGFQSICKQKCKHLVRCKWYNWMYLLTYVQCHP